MHIRQIDVNLRSRQGLPEKETDAAGGNVLGDAFDRVGQFDAAQDRANAQWLAIVPAFAGALLGMSQQVSAQAFQDDGPHIFQEPDGLSPAAAEWANDRVYLRAPHPW